MNLAVLSPSHRRLASLLVMAVWLPTAPAAVAEAPLPTGLHAWFKADAGVTVTGGTVTAWADQTVNGFVLTPPATGPVLTAASVNGLPALAFSGTSQLNGSLGAGPLGDATIFAIFRYTVADSDNDYLYALGAAAGAGSQLTLSRRSSERAGHLGQVWVWQRARLHGLCFRLP